MFARTRTDDHRRWPLVLIAAPAGVATWSGWVGLGEKAGFGPVTLLPGIADQFVVNTAITLPIGIEAYAAYAIGVWLSSRTMGERTRQFAMVSGISSLLLGAFGQIAYHLLEVFGQHVAPWQVVVGVSCLPIAVVGMTAVLLHLLRADAGPADPSRWDVDVYDPDLPVPTTRLELVPPVAAMEVVEKFVPDTRQDVPPSLEQAADVPPPKPRRASAAARPAAAVRADTGRDAVLPFGAKKTDDEVRDAIRAERDARGGTLPAANWVKRNCGTRHDRASRLIDDVRRDASRAEVAG
jgi:hypothetical protein